MSQHNDETGDAGVTRRSVMKAAGVATIGLGAVTATSGTAAASYECVDCVCFGKIDGRPEKGDTYTFSKDGYKIQVKILDVRREDGEVVRFEWQVTNKYDYLAVCKVGVKGGPQTNWREFENGSYHAWAHAPKHRRNRNRKFYAVSNFTFCFCIPQR